MSLQFTTPLSRHLERDATLPRKLATLLIVAVILQSARVMYVLAGGPDRIVNFLPDDAFYYFQMAKNFAALGRWTFDGTAPATGFHLLWGYLWAAIFRLAPHMSLVALYLISFGVGVLCYSASAIALAILVTECYGSGALPAIYAALLGTSLFVVPALGMESAPTLLCASLAFLLLFRPRRTAWSRAELVALYAVGLLGMLSRSDFGVLIFSALLAYGIVNRWRGTLSLYALQPALICFAGAVSGLMLVLAHSWVVSGHLFQSSAQTKYYWSSLNGHSLQAPLMLLASSLAYKLPFAGLLMYPVLAALCAVAIIGVRYVYNRELPVMPLLAAALAVAGYVVLYSRDSRALQLWYVASFGVPLIVICAPAFVALGANRPRVVLGAVGVAIAAMFALSLRPIWPHQFAMKDAGLLLASRPELRPVGAWNAGLISYFAGRPVTNLDGLVNDDILAYAKAGTLRDYIRERQLAYIVDYRAMLDPGLALRGGYADGLLRECLTAEREIDSDKPRALWQDSPMTLYRVDASCVGARSAQVR